MDIPPAFPGVSAALHSDHAGSEDVRTNGVENGLGGIGTRFGKGCMEHGYALIGAGGGAVECGAEHARTEGA